jgi:hypothetical protein
MDRLYLYRSGCIRRFGGPDKEMRSISLSDKLCRSNGVEMFPSEAVGREAE